MLLGSRGAEELGDALWWPGRAAATSTGRLLPRSEPPGCLRSRPPRSPPGPDCSCDLLPSARCSFAYVMMQRWLDAAKCFNFILTYISK